MSKKIQYLRKKDINAVNDNLDSIIEKAQNKKIQLIEPKLDENGLIPSERLNLI